MGQRADKKTTLPRKPAGGALADWSDGPHPLTYGQTEYTLGLVTGALGKDEPDGRPSRELQRACDGLLEASVPAEFKDAGSSLAVDWKPSKKTPCKSVSNGR